MNSTESKRWAELMALAIILKDKQAEDSLDRIFTEHIKTTSEELSRITHKLWYHSVKQTGLKIDGLGYDEEGYENPKT